ncbi:MAG: tryptophan--tRNA ligase [Candidatus Tagabacteria bacterium CG09_land_8_20_14_0_10_41_14]|uniref:Tryptophan--tRNA ligase n=2 Tax=Candidatus Tagaibacteriota TaxID=1817918 RepID=A0A2H0WLY6_9BACT|nr:MAG: tryptophan--tRNA ligase [Candidatus Tagabacteria bacterium CG09_land_8_20_14_0_10_41_14]PJE73359.1 MAG: tryptophan--tRNA ligase [Candidatus Tagabacteria bacterium CG10_big_fil_rev_8_21_14_0_10_40_13]
MNKKRVFSGIQPSGGIHIGNYLGAIKNWVDFQKDYDNIFCVVDLHTITVRQDPKILKEKIRETAGLLLACGIDVEKSVLFAQSYISAHSELAWILNCFTPMGWLEKMTQFKEKAAGGRERASVGLFDYPVLMAADILLYDTDVVPVGEDQVQHVELARDVAKRFNSLYEKDIFKIPEVKIKKETARVMGLSNSEKKMSKSDAGENNAINLLDTPDVISKKIMAAATDSENKILFDINRPAIYNLLVIYESFSGLTKGEIESKFVDGKYADFKKDLAELVAEKLKPIREKYKEISESGEIEKVLKQGADKARPMAEAKLKEVKEVIGLG